MNRPALKWKLVCLAAAGAVCGADQALKFAMRRFMESRGGAELDLIPGFLTLVHSYNTGVAFGMFQGARPFLILLPVIVVIGILICFLKFGDGRLFSLAGLAFMLGGAAGNLVDRVGSGMVYDFIDMHVGAAHWPAFNAADTFIVVGVALFAIAMARGEIDV